MARLNEPMVSTDSVETLRRKFLRQNRDIARVNSTQSLKIRSLENECVRLLSENLDLRGQVLRLQTELEDSKAQKIADHALEIKEKMEAQLAEWGTMLASLGHEPIPKSRSPRESKKAKHRSSIGRMTMSEWKRRDTMNSSSMKDLEEAAAQEGRLAPIWENKPCPRETLTRDEILALRSVVDDNDDSPDLGPPPVSRFVDEDPVKIDLPARRFLTKSDYLPQDKASPEPEARPELPPSPKVSPKVDERKDEVISDATTANVESQNSRPSLPESPTNNTVKASLKRKQREEDDEKENAVISKPPPPSSALVKGEPEKTMNAKPRSLGRPIKPPTSRKEARDKTSGSTAPRKPLSAKSSNEYIKSPKKTTKPSGVEEIAKDNSKAKKTSSLVEIPPPQSPEPLTVMNVEVETTETETLSAEPDLAIPDTPEPTPKDDVRYTPPPSDISSRGETSRGSRRARAAVSYAEPNLRDKMRRPSKQLLDAVSGEGKNIRRTSQSSSGPSSVIKSEERPGSWKDLPSAHSARSTPDVMASPLAQKGSRNSSTDDLTTSIAVNRKTRNPQGGANDLESSTLLGGSNGTKSGSRSTNRRLHDIAAREAEVAKMFDADSDVYEIPHTTPTGDSKRTVESEDAIAKKAGTNKGSRRSRARRLSSVIREDLDLEPEAQANQKGPRQAGSTRRATMAAPKDPKAELENSGLESSLEGDSLTSTSSADTDGSARDRVATRRRSMML
ncbi:hypothetical protein F5B19DRAFT_482599 [Rostrohypoxylon terebratum]|nr:hypothetical protein F5B19DRAFT_482599 [Rostrohypoxylon terebratum]